MIARTAAPYADLMLKSTLHHIIDTKRNRIAAVFYIWLMPDDLKSEVVLVVFIIVARSRGVDAAPDDVGKT